MAIDFQHPEYKENIERWKLADNICSSRNVEQYLIELNPTDTSTENIARNKQYKERAVLYTIAGHTLQGLIGLLFSKPPIIELPSQLEYMLANVDGSGVSINQQAQDSSSNVIKKGRSGLFVTYPKTEGAVSRADMDNGSLVATINKVEAEQVINWATETKGSKTFLSLVVIHESVEVVTDYEIEEIEQLRELALIDGVFNVREWRKDDKKEWQIFSESIPTDSAGNTWSEIPFTFIGSQSNTSVLDDAPIYPLVKINVAHYRNSADYEDSVWYVGQAQPWMSGINKTHIDLMKKNDMYVGSRSLLGVPTGESFGFASADPNPLVRQAMLDKLEMLIGLGARFVQENGRVKTASEDNNDEKAQHSTLGLVSVNISEAYTQAIQWAARYMGASEDGTYTATMDFISPTASAQDIQAMFTGFISGAYPISSYFRWLKKMDLEDENKTLEEFAEEVAQTRMPDLDSADNE